MQKFGLHYAGSTHLLAAENVGGAGRIGDFGWILESGNDCPYFEKHDFKLLVENPNIQTYSNNNIYTGKQEGLETGYSNVYATLPVTWSYPFTQLPQIDPENIRTTTVKLNDSTNNTNGYLHGYSFYPKDWSLLITYVYESLRGAEKQQLYLPSDNYGFMNMVWYLNWKWNTDPDIDWHAEFYLEQLWNGTSEINATGPMPAQIEFMKEPFTFGAAFFGGTTTGLTGDAKQNYINNPIWVATTTQGSSSIQQPDGTTVNSKGQEWYLDCENPSYSSPQIGSCQEGTYRITWDSGDMFKNSHPSLTATASYDPNAGWQILSTTQ